MIRGTNYHIEVTSYPIAVTSHHIAVTSHHIAETSYHIAVTSLHLQVTSYHITVTSYHITVTSHHIAVTSYHIAVTSQHIQVTSYHITVTSYHKAVTNRHIAVTSYKMGKTSEAPSTVELDNQGNITAVSENTLVAALPDTKQNNFLKQLDRRKTKPSTSCLTMKSLSLDLHDQPSHKKYLKRVASMSTMRSIPEHGSCLYQTNQEDNMPSLRTPVSIDNGYKPAHLEMISDVTPDTSQTKIECKKDINTWSARSDKGDGFNTQKNKSGDIKIWSEKTSDIYSWEDSKSDIDTWTEKATDIKTWTDSPSDINTWTDGAADMTDSTGDIDTWTDSTGDSNTWTDSMTDINTRTNRDQHIKPWADTPSEIDTWTNITGDANTWTDPSDINTCTWTCSDISIWTEWIFTIMLNLSVWILCLGFVIWNIFYIPCFIFSNDFHLSYDYNQ